MPNIPKNWDFSNQNKKNNVWTLAINFEEWHDNLSESTFSEHISQWWDIEGRVEGGFQHIYTIPEIKNRKDLISFFENFLKYRYAQKIIMNARYKNNDDKNTAEELWEIENIDFNNNSELIKKIEKDILLAVKMAQQYITSQPRPSLNSMMGVDITSIKSLLEFHTRNYNAAQKNISNRVYYCIFLKKILIFFRIIHSGKFKINYDEGTINLKNKHFIHKIIEIFNNENTFSYKNTNNVNTYERFSKTSDQVHAIATIDDVSFPVKWSFNVKSVDRVVSKMSRDPDYNTVNALKDIHRMRLEVWTPLEAIRLGKFLFENFSNMQVSIKGGMITKDTYDAVEKFYDEISFDYGFQVLEQIEKNKNTIPDKNRQELRLSRPAIDNEEWFEIQIVLNDNMNETGWYSHHKIYEMKGMIEEVIADKGYISKKHIEMIIDHFIKENKKNKKSPPINFTEEQIYNHIIGNDSIFMIVNPNKDPNSGNPAFTTRKNLINYRKNYPETTQKNNIWAVTHIQRNTHEFIIATLENFENTSK